MVPARAILVDFGGVLYHPPNPKWMHRMQRWFRLPDTGLVLMSRLSPQESLTVLDIMTGKTSEQSVWEEFARHWRIPPAMLARLRRSALDPKRLNTELIQFLAEHKKRVKTAILTNAGTEFRQTFCQGYGLEEVVDQVIISAEEQLAKPDPRIYQLAANRLGIAPNEVVFVDDLPENIAGALAVGMQAVLYQNNQQLLPLLRDILPGDDSRL